MGLRKVVKRRKNERMSDTSFKLMTLFFRTIDFIYPYLDKRIKKFGIKPGITIVDYGCGPGRYTTRFAKLVGEQGRVFAIDIHELAIEAVKKKSASTASKTSCQYWLKGMIALYPTA